MAYGKLAEGARVFTAANGLADPADINETEDQLYGMLGPLNVSPCISTAFFDDSFGATSWHLRYVLGYLAWQNAVAGAVPLWHCLGTMRTGQKITGIDVVVKGTAVGGSITLQAQSVSTPSSIATIATFPANPWNTAGVWTPQPGTIAGSTHTVITDNQYYLILTPTGAAVNEYYAGCTYTIQFGN